ncbi:hypothetical protein CK203_114445 [Vitis vinifera]|uniref:Mitochondrial protein n=1 Tax=Vitis vinifera TaxID=29760 RepID=A0A438CY84_VITVI|nr:hypothetical protein CK203_114445 [Vitis vinifera]
MDVEVYMDANWGGSTGKISTYGYCTLVGSKLVTWRSKKQLVVAKLSVKAEYKAMALGISNVFTKEVPNPGLGLMTGWE